MKTATQKAIQRPPAGRIFIVNGVSIWREALLNAINRAPDLEVCGLAFDELSAYEQVSRLRPHLILTEILRPQDLGFIRELHRRHPRLPILAFSFRDEEAYAPRALEAGACGYLMKDAGGDTLLAGIRKALKGRRVLSPVMAQRLRRRQGRSKTGIAGKDV